MFLAHQNQKFEGSDLLSGDGDRGTEQMVQAGLVTSPLPAVIKLNVSANNFAFVEFRSVEECSSALSLDGVSLGQLRPTTQKTTGILGVLREAFTFLAVSAARDAALGLGRAWQI